MAVQEIREFNRSAQDFFSHRKEESSSQIHQSLLVIAANWNDSFFDTDDYLVFHSFLSNIQKVLTHGERLPELSWAAVDVLSCACSTPSVREYLIRSFTFMPCLTNHLYRLTGDSDESKEKKILILLELMQEITYGIKILWHESYLQVLTTTIKDLVCSRCNENIVAAALGVLVNLCYGNHSVVGAITRTINIKKLLKTILKSHKHRDNRIRVEVSKLIIVLGEDVTEAELEIDFFMKATAPSLVEALSLKNASRMRHILAFLEEIVESRKFGQLLHYSDCKKEVESMLSIVESDEVPPECLAAVFRYFTILIAGEAKTEDIWELSVMLFRLALNHANKRQITKEALTLAAAVVSRFLVEKQSNGSSSIAERIFDSLVEHLPMLLSFLDVTSLNVEVCERLSALMTLLSASLKIINMSDVVQHFELSTFRTLFETLKKPELKNNNLFHASIYTFYVKTLTFLSELSDKEASWLLLFNQLLQEEDVQMVLSVALYTGSEEIKKKVLSLTVTTGFSLECLTVMAKCLTKVNNLIVFFPGGQQGHRIDPERTRGYDRCSIEAPSITSSQENRIDPLLKKIESTLGKGDSSPTTSSVIELYQIKIAALTDSRKRLEKAQEAADARAAELREELALAQAEFTRLHNLLPGLQMSVEEAKKEKSRLAAKITEAETKANQVSRTLKTKTYEIVRLNEEVDQIKKESSQELMKQRSEIEKLKLELEELNAKLTAQEKVSSKNEEALKKQLGECRKEIDAKCQQMEQLKKDIVNQSNQTAKVEKSKNEVESKYLELKKHLNMISELSRKDI